MTIYRVAVIIFSVLAASASAAETCSGCGCRGGPGYRGPNGQCVSWKQLKSVCGVPPTERCTPEHTNTDGEEDD